MMAKQRTFEVIGKILTCPRRLPSLLITGTLLCASTLHGQTKHRTHYGDYTYTKIIDDISDDVKAEGLSTNSLSGHGDDGSLLVLCGDRVESSGSNGYTIILTSTNPVFADLVDATLRFDDDKATNAGRWESKTSGVTVDAMLTYVFPPDDAEAEIVRRGRVANRLIVRLSNPDIAGDESTLSFSLMGFTAGLKRLDCDGALRPDAGAGSS